jgi:hypothetical protein
MLDDGAISKDKENGETQLNLALKVCFRVGVCEQSNPISAMYLQP